MRKKKEELSKGILSPSSDVLSCLLELRDENQQPIADDMIIDNYVTLMIASHHTSAILISLMIWKLARDPEIYRKVLEGNYSNFSVQYLAYFLWLIAITIFFLLNYL